MPNGIAPVQEAEDATSGIRRADRDDIIYVVWFQDGGMMYRYVATTVWKTAVEVARSINGVITQQTLVGDFRKKEND